MKKTKKYFYYLLGLSLLLLAIRLIFFLQDGTNDQIESLLIQLIFFVSLVSLADYVYINFETIKKHIYFYMDRIIITIGVLLLELGFMLDNHLEVSRTYIFSFLFIMLLIHMVGILLPKKLNKGLTYFFFFFFVIYLLGQDLYIGIFNDLFSFKEYGTVQEGIESSESMFKITGFHIYGLLISALTIFSYIKHHQISHVSISKKVILSMLSVLWIPFLLIQINANYPVKAARLHTSDHYLYQSIFSRKDFVSRFGAVNLLFRDSIGVLIPDLSTRQNIKYLNDYYLEHAKTHVDNDYTGIFEGKNLIYILAESYDEIALSEVLTPNLYRLKYEGMHFDNHYTPVYPRTTSDTEFILNTGIIPSIEDGPTCYVYNRNSYQTSLASLFNQNGYLTQAFHSNYKEFYTRHMVYAGYGYDQFYGQHEIGLTDIDIRYDSEFYNQAKDYVTSPSEPFFSFMITLSGHSPYTDSNLAVLAHKDQVEAYYGNQIPLSIRNYIATQIELDLMIGELFSDLEEKNLLDDTVIILSGDHYPYTLNQDDFEAYANISELYQKQRGNLYVWSSDRTETTILELSSSFDILPMINNWFNLGGDYNYYIGNDIFGTPNTQVYFKDYTTYDGTELLTLSANYNGLFEEQITKAQNYYEISKRILRSNYFKFD